MEIRTNRPREARATRIVPPPDRARSRKKNPRNMGQSPMTGRRFAALLRAAGRAGALLLLVAALVSGYIYATGAEVFNLRRVRVHGCRELDPARLEAIVLREFPANILKLDLGAVRGRLMQETWAHEVEVLRVLPSDLVLYVRERVPAVILEMNGALMVTDAEGVLLGRYEPRFGKLDVPVFRGVMGEDAETYQMYQEENSARITRGLEMLAEIASGSPRYTRIISEVDIADRDNLKVVLVNDTAEVVLGEKDYLKRFTKFVNNPAEYRKLKDQYTEIEHIDLRFDSQIVYRLRQTDPSKNQTAKLEDRRQGNP
ncbi:MAG: FtsQ-type POTRA domain-containing protein [Acidobacteriota bacterium]|jgi:cell division septal protein FtsQ|nr:FtsQ-type POTRA domain-containing protein [Acidobacteriota bacterium]